MTKSTAFITCFGGSDLPDPEPTTPKPTAQDSRVTASRDNERRRRASAASNTVLTSYGGVQTQAPTQTKTLLGQ